MKRVWTLTVVTIALCAATVLARPRMALAVPKTMSPEGPATSGSMQEIILSNEQKELDSLKTGNLELFASLLAEDAIFLDDHGPAGKAEVVKNVGQFRILDYSIDDVRFLALSTNSGLIAYKLTAKGTSYGKEFSEQVYVSAVWAKQGNKWVSRFSQETATKEPSK
jgi:hypothetical protein